MGQLEKYSSYKDSGVEWLGEIPENWGVISIKRLMTLLTDYTANGSFADLAKYVQYLDEPNYAQLIRLTDIRKGFESKGGVYINEKSYKYLKKSSLFGGELLMANVGAYSGHSFLLPEKLNFNASLAPNMFLIKFNNNQIDNKLIYYILNSATVLSRLVLIATSTAQPKLNKDNVRSIFIPIPPKNEQLKIASFLDEKTAQIDEVISQKQKLIELLKERKQIVINDAVTKGLDKDVEFVDSGFEWIGNIPKHWEIKKLKYVFKEINERSETGEEELLSLSKYQGVIPKSSLEERAGMAKTLVGYKKVYKNDLVINKMQAVNGLLAVSKIEGITSPDYAVYRTISDKYNIDYYGNLLSQSVYLSEFKKVVTGVMEGFIRLYTDDLYNIIVQVPPKDEQLQIVEHIENQTTKIDKAIELQQNYISKLKEYKVSLIDSVVTGKVKVYCD